MTNEASVLFFKQYIGLGPINEHQQVQTRSWCDSPTVLHILYLFTSDRPV